MKNNKIFRTILTVTSAAFLVSCNALEIVQDNKLSQSNMWKTSVQVKGSTYGIYSRIRSNFIQDQINQFFWGELRVGSYMWGPSEWYGVWVGKDVMDNKMSANTTSVSWSALYSAIDQANAVLKYAPQESINMTDAERDWCIGQAAFARAYCYFWAARLWGDVPLNLAPIESTTQPECYPVRAPKAQVYEQIGKDIELALSKKDALGNDSYYATPKGVLMLQAEYALWMYATQGGKSSSELGQKYLGMAETALSTIGISQSLILDDYGEIFDRMADPAKPSKASAEVVFAMYNDQAEGLTGGYSRYFTFPSGDIANSYWGVVPLMETQWLNYAPEFLALLRESRDKNKDSRVKYNLGDAPVAVDGSNRYWCNKYTGQMGESKSIRDCDIVLYRTAQAVMMYAEMKYFKGDYQGALNALNIIAKRAYGKDNYYTDKSPEAVLKAIEHEYFLEFPAEGVIWWALIRLDTIWDYNAYLRENKTKTNILLWPISKSARDKNSNLTQTEGWY